MLRVKMKEGVMPAWIKEVKGMLWCGKEMMLK